MQGVAARNDASYALVGGAVALIRRFLAGGQ